MKKVALISGITGQDGSFLAEFLIEKGYEVHGILRRSSSFNTGRIEHLYLDEWVRDMQKTRLVNLHWGDMTDSKFRCTRVHCGSGCGRHAAYVGSGPYSGPGKEDQDLSGIDFRIVRTGTGSASEGNDSLLSPFSVWGGQAVWFLDYQELS